MYAPDIFFGAQRPGAKMLQTCSAKMTLNGALLSLNFTAFTDHDAQLCKPTLNDL